MRTKVRFGLGLVAVLALAVGLLAPPMLMGQVTPPSPAIYSLAVTNDVPNNSTTTANLGGTIDCSQYADVGVQIKYELNAAGTTACTFNFVRSADGTNWNTTAPIAISFVPNGATAVVTNTSITMGALPYLKCSGITAANNTAAMTNISVVYVFKPGRKEYLR